MLLREKESDAKTWLIDDYEQLRAYVVSPAKTPLRPLGLDLWFKKGFLTWSEVVFHDDSLSDTVRRMTEKDDNPSIPADISISLANILIERSEKNGGYQNQE